MPPRKVEYATLRMGRATVRLGWIPFQSAYRSNAQHDNFLKVHGQVTTPDGEWSFADPCLCVQEVLQLVQWLRTSHRSRATLAFIEPCISFAASSSERADFVDLEITFKGEISPPWIMGDSDRVWGDGWTLHASIPSVDLTRFADQLVRLIGG